MTIDDIGKKITFLGFNEWINEVREKIAKDKSYIALLIDSL